MAEFQDTFGNRWTIDLTVLDFRRVRTAAGIDMAKTFTPDGIAWLADPAQVFDVLVVLLGPQMETRGVAVDDLAHGLTGVAYHDAVDALAEGLLDFLHPSEDDPIRLLWTKTKAMMAHASETVKEAIERLHSDQLVNSGPR